MISQPQTKFIRRQELMQLLAQCGLNDWSARMLLERKESEAEEKTAGYRKTDHLLPRYYFGNSSRALYRRDEVVTILNLTHV